MPQPYVPTDEEKTRKPPQACPDCYKQDFEKWEPEPRAILAAHEVPYYIIAGMAADGYHSLADLGYRYDDMTKTKEKAPDDYEFTHAKCGAYTDKTMIFAATRLGQAVTAAQQIRKDRTAALSDTSHAPVASIITAQSRDSMAQAYKRRAGRLPDILHQGSNHYLGSQYKECFKGQIGFFTSKQIVGQMQNPTLLHKVHKKERDNQGNSVTEEHDERSLPKDSFDWMDQLQIFRTTLLMLSLIHISEPTRPY